MESRLGEMQSSNQFLSLSLSCLQFLLLRPSFLPNGNRLKRFCTATECIANLSVVMYITAMLRRYPSFARVPRNRSVTMDLFYMYLNIFGDFQEFKR
jgi:hypothetical protein